MENYYLEMLGRNLATRDRNTYSFARICVRGVFNLFPMDDIRQSLIDDFHK